MIESEANGVLSLTRDEGDLGVKLKTDMEGSKRLLASVCRGVVTVEFEILKKSSIEVIQHRLLRQLQEINFSKSKDFPTLLPILFDFNTHCFEMTGVNGPILQHVKSILLFFMKTEIKIH